MHLAVTFPLRSNSRYQPPVVSRRETTNPEHSFSFLESNSYTLEISPARGTSGDLRHPRRSRYRCSLPGLAGFAGPRCTEPEVPRSGGRASFYASAKKSLAQRLERSQKARALSLQYALRRSLLSRGNPAPPVRAMIMILALLPPARRAAVPRMDLPNSL